MKVLGYDGPGADLPANAVHCLDDDAYIRIPEGTTLFACPEDWQHAVKPVHMSVDPALPDVQANEDAYHYGLSQHVYDLVEP